MKVIWFLGFNHCRNTELRLSNLYDRKWHLGFGGEKTSALPFNRGFDRTFILDATGGDNFSNHSYLPYYKEAPWFKDGKPTQLPENFYSSEFLIDEMIEYIDGGDRISLFFLMFLFKRNIFLFKFQKNTLKNT